MKYRVYMRDKKGNYVKVEETDDKEELRKYIGKECQVIRSEDKSDEIVCKNEIEKEIDI